MRRASWSVLLLVLAVGLPGVARAQQAFCAHKVRHIQCHFADGKDVVYDTDAASEFYNMPPYITFRTSDGLLHQVIGQCEITCRP